MNKMLPITLTAVAGLLGTLPSAKGTPYIDRLSWEASVATWDNVDETQWPLTYTLDTDDNLIYDVFEADNPILLPLSGASLFFNADLISLQVPDDGVTWPSPNTPRVLSHSSSTPLVGTFSAAVSAFGLEIEPNDFDVYTITLQLLNGSTIEQDGISGNADARFFGWSGELVSGFTITSTDSSGFLLGRLVEGAGSPPPVGTPDGGSLFLLSGLLWTGMAGFKRWSKRV